MNNKKLIELAKAIGIAYACIFGMGYLYAVANKMIIDLTNSMWIFSIAYIGIGYLIVNVVNRFCKLDKITATVISIFALIMTIVQSEVFLALMLNMDSYNVLPVFVSFSSIGEFFWFFFWFPIRFGIIGTFDFNLDNMSHILFLVISIIYTAKHAYYNAGSIPVRPNKSDSEIITPLDSEF